MSRNPSLPPRSPTFVSSSPSSPSSPTMLRKPKAVPLVHSISSSGVVFPSPSPSALAKGKFPAMNVTQFIDQLGSVQEHEDFMYQLLSSMPRSQLSSLQRRIAPLLQFDVVGSLPTEVALQIFSNLPPHTLLICALVSKRWNVLANDQSLWKALCHAQGWEWRQPPEASSAVEEGSSGGSHARAGAFGAGAEAEDEDEGMGDSDDDEHVPAAAGGDSFMDYDIDSGFASGSILMHQPSASNSVARLMGNPPSPSRARRHTAYIPQLRRNRSSHKSRYSAPVNLPSFLSLSRSSSFNDPTKPDFKRLYRTHTHLHNRFLTSSYRLSVIQTRGSPPNGHANMIYCVQLYTYPTTNHQVIFTGSRDKTIREWSLCTGEVERVFGGVHTESVLSLCARNGWMVSAGSDWRVILWNLDNRSVGKGKGIDGNRSGGSAVVKVLRDHADSVLCVRFDDERLVSCSKDRTVRVYTFPGLELLHVLGGHRAAVNAISLSKDYVVSGSGDRSMNVWDVKTGKLIRTFEDHHTRGIASIDFKPPYIVSGSSDKHIRLVDMKTSQGWSTSPEYDTTSHGLGLPGLGLGLTPLGPAHAPFLPRHLYPQYSTEAAVTRTGWQCACANRAEAPLVIRPTLVQIPRQSLPLILPPPLLLLSSPRHRLLQRPRLLFLPLHLSHPHIHTHSHISLLILATLTSFTTHIFHGVHPHPHPYPHPQPRPHTTLTHPYIHTTPT
ncbi:F-box/WD repeat-containing protein 1A [Leucoagaricus sp. SymC.cos]|nr:F-box/WD repeat-containing protein 1A [Leucoagaricus sp. SymC.cos]